MRRLLILAATCVLLLLPVAVWMAFKPVRVLAPEWLGLHCAGPGICVDDTARLAEAVALKAEAVAFVEERVGRFDRMPRLIFCATAACGKAYGFTHQGAYTVATFGIVIGPRGWEPHFVRHELIHHIQVERFGSIAAWLWKPSWFMEGMAYALSEDPRRPLPDPLDGWRQRFEAWYPAVGRENLWNAAAGL